MNLLHRQRPLLRPMASDLRSVRHRATFIGAVLFVCMLGLLYKGYIVAVEHHEYYAEQGNRQQLRNYRLTASRGDVVDRGYIALAVNDRAYKIVVNPRLIRAQGNGETVVAAVLEMFPQEDPDYVRRELAHDKAYRRLRLTLDDGQAKSLRARGLAGVRLERVPERVYPRKHLAAHVVGRVNAQGRGNLGVEYGMEEYLRGRDATSPAYFARGKKLLVDGFPDPGVPRGHTIVLTIDSAIQAMAEEELDTLVTNWRPAGASIVVLEPSSGEVLALANRPTFDPNHPVPHLAQTVNLAAQSAYEPGSTIKAITVAAALEEGAIRRDETFFCEEGRWQYTPDHAIRDTKPAEWLNVTEILAVSSNICTTKIAEKLGKQTLHRWVRRFHFGERPPTRLPGATPGLLVAWQKWSDIKAANVAFGQGMSASPLQVTAAFAALANGGVYNAPRIVKRVIANDHTIVWQHEPTRERVVRTGTAKTVMRMLESVVHERIGTGKNAKISGYRVAGKTSTAQKASTRGGYEEDQYYASFVGAVPAEAPKVVILVSVDDPQERHYGNDVAAPTFARLGARVMTHLSVPREDGTVPAPDTIALRESSDELVEGFIPELDVEPELPGARRVPFTTGLPDFTGLSLAEALDAAEQAQVELRAVGSGIAVMQDVSPGPIDSGTTVSVLFEPAY